jgi:hypothetical protein
MSCPRCPVHDVLSKTACPDSSVLSRLSCLNYALVPAALPRPHGPPPDTTLMSWQSCHLSPFQAHLSRLPACMSQLSSLNRRSYSIPVVLSLLSCPCCHILAVLPLFPILAVLSCVSFRLSCPGWFFPAVLLNLSYASCPAQLSCPGCIVTAALSQLSCSSCSAHTSLSTALLMPLSCPGSPVFIVLSRLTHPG